jgi:hypothetical protein
VRVAVRVGSAGAQVQAPTTIVSAAPLASSPATVAKLACARRCDAAGAVPPGSLLRVRRADVVAR